MAMRFHPDRNPGDETAADKFSKVATAYEILSDLNKRREYDSGDSSNIPDVDVNSVKTFGRLGLCCASHIILIKTVINPAKLATAKALMRGEKINDSVSIAEPGKIYNRNITFQESEDAGGCMMAALYFAPFDYIESPSSFSSEKGGNTVFKLLSSLKIVSARTLKEGYHLFCVSGNNWFSDFAYKFTAINLYDNEVLHRHIKDTKKEVIKKVEEVAGMRSNYLVVEKEYRDMTGSGRKGNVKVGRLSKVMLLSSNLLY
ncbi:unnamed protein product [Enterobius vermicularis]|uniref:J domain-containing protein n=1 Tax=Enterobius vermicularis TaxID=51028 RepID=A0A0N4V865_ENTVE|nr:unnamed protein product [Enterobius vermicularis]